MGIEGREISEHVMEITSTSNNINVLSYPTMVADVMEKKIKKITTSNGTIEFKRNPSRRQDLRYDSYALDEIVITNGNNTINKRFKFQMSYFEANNTRKYTGVNASTFTYLNYRLRLDAIQELNSAGQAVKPPYTISYLGDNNPATDDKYTLPHRLSSSQDHWGYYNQTNNSHIFPGNPQGRPIPMDKTYQIFLPNTGLSINNVMSNGANRSVDTAAAKAGLIKELHYPTGGYTAFTFESNSFSWFTTEYGAGIRVKEIANYTGGTVSSKKIYEYQYGHITHHPVDHYYTYFHVYYHTSGGPRIATDILTAFRLPVGHSYTANGRKFVKIRALPQNMLGATSMVTYQSVTVREPGNGRTLYLYDTSSQFPDYTSAESSYDLLDAGKIPQQFYMQFVSSIDPGGFDSPFEFSVSKLEGIGIMDFPYPPIYSNEWKRGVLTNQNIYNEAGHLVTKIEKKYYRQTMKTIPAWKVVAFRNQSEFISVKYFVPQGWIYQNKEIITQYDANGQNPHTTETDFLHGNPSHAQLTKMTKQLSDGTKEITSIAYADDYNDLTGFVGNMKSENLKSYPIEEVTYKEVGTTQTILSGNITTYKTGGKGLVDQALELETSTPLALSSFRFSNRSAVNQLPPIGANANYSPDTRYKVRLTHDAHDAKGNLLQYTTSQGPPVSYLWGYNYQYPIAEGQNAGQYDIAYVGFEAVEQNLSLINVGTVADASAPTGRRVGTMVGSQSPKITKYGLTGGKSYILTYWVKNNSTMPSFEGGTVTAAELVRTKGAWKCYRHRVSNVSTLAIKITTGSTTIDDIRLHPVDGQLDTYTYDPLVGMTSHTDAAGNVAHYEYDTLGRLLLIRDLEGKVIEDYRYNYSN